MSDLIERLEHELELHRLNPAYEPDLWILAEESAARIKELEALVEAYKEQSRLWQHKEPDRDAIEAATIEKCVDALYECGLLTIADAMHGEGAIRLALKPPTTA